MTRTELPGHPGAQDLLPPHLPVPKGVRHAAFSDFDETYLAHAATPQQRAYLADLERFLHSAALDHGLLFGWVTGSSLASVRAKMGPGGATVLPHFVASSLGTELVFFEDGVAVADQAWQERLRDSGFSRTVVDEVVEHLAGQGIDLFPQDDGNATEFLRNYYFRTLGNPERDAEILQQVRELAERHGLGLNINRCNPAAGDPADCYDVDFLPRMCGKHHVVSHVCARFGIAPERTLAFGDSGNDLAMLRSVRHGYLVGNCTPEARAEYPRVSEYDYTQALLEAFRQHL